MHYNIFNIKYEDDCVSIIRNIFKITDSNEHQLK